MLRTSLFSVGLAAAALTSAAVADAQNALVQPQDSAKEWLQARQAEMAQYEFTVADQSSHRLKLEPRSLLNWSNAERGADVGAVFLWTRQGRPLMIACAFGRDRTLRHEFHSLSEGSLTGLREGGEFHRFDPGLSWQKLPDAPAAAKERPLRLAQMRRQAQRFRVVMGIRDAAEMRLLTQPVFRSPADSDEDIGLFVFVQGTDPECVLQFRVTAEGMWQYAITRQTKWPLRVELDGKQVAEYLSIGKTPDGAPFFVLTPAAAKEE